jgi:Protein of unknown function (DUF4038)/Putative collagen-binding domain of a collagenase
MKSWTLLALVAGLLFCTHRLRAQLPRLRVSDNRRFLVTQDGQPFFWLGDTGWELFHRLNSQDAEAYFKKRSEQGFTVIQAVALAELDGLHTPNANGVIPLAGDDPAKPNAAYFNYIDTLIDLAAKYHLYIALLPTWGDKVYKNRWGIGPEIFNSGNAYGYGMWIGTRFKQKTNLIWIIGGDRSPREGSDEVAIWRAMAKGVQEGVGGASVALMTFHPQPDGSSSSSQWFEQDGWLDINMLQTGHCRDTPVWELVGQDYAKTPVRPVVNGENIYEEMPVCFNPKELGYANAYDVRKAAYLSVFAGALGHTYGCGPVIWFSRKGGDFFSAFHSWNEALDLTGAGEMRYLRALIESRPMLERIPDQSILADEGCSPQDRVEATRGRDYAFIYSAYGRPVQVHLNKLGAYRVSANWYDPRTGKTRFIGTYPAGSEQVFTPPLPESSPAPSQREDWVLILDNADRHFPMPGSN